MASLALRALGAVALPGAFLAVVAPAASAADLAPASSATEVAPLSDIDGGNATKGTGDDAARGTSALPDTSELLSGENLSF